jgi:hypothetical protein
MMTLNNTDNALLIILSIFLAVFLLLGIISLVYFLKIEITVKRVFKKVEVAIDKAEKLGNVFEKAAPIFGVFKHLSKFNKGKKDS